MGFPAKKVTVFPLDGWTVDFAWIRSELVDL